MAVIILITALFVCFCALLFQHLLRGNLLQYTRLNLALLSENISKEMINLESMVKECASSKSVIHYFDTSEPYTQKNFTEAYTTFYNEYTECSSHNFINRILLCSYSDHSKLMEISKKNNVRMKQPTDYYIENSDGYKEYMKTPAQPLVTIAPSPFEGSVTKKVITILYPIGATLTTDPDAFIYLEVSPSIISNYVENYDMDDGCLLFLNTGNITYRITSDNFIVDHKSAHHQFTILDQEITFSDWSISQTVTYDQLYSPVRFYFAASAAIAVTIIIFGILYSVYLSRLITRPVYKLRQRIIAISYGHFEFDDSIEWPDEFGDIGRGINTMSRHISELMDKRLAAEKNRSDLEYEMLLSQMTPHFVYNTLNTIRWMAQIQNAEGIAEITGALARLMKNISKLPATTIPVAREFELIDDYFKIIQIRYGSAITLNYHILDEAVLQNDILKFTLQPLVENAIFHGIEPKHLTGTIDITAGRKNDHQFYITIRDDGMGIDPDKIPLLLSEDAPHTTDGLTRHVGLYNVNKRLHHTFGPEYGLSITSETGKFTEITVTLPFSERRDTNVETASGR